jgi:Na+/H+ antiporter NhaA
MAELYMMFLNVVGEVRIGSLAVEKPLFLWVNDGFMAIFFLLVGMEIKREMQEGYLADSRQLILPGAAACAGILVPALNLRGVQLAGSGRLDRMGYSNGYGYCLRTRSARASGETSACQSQNFLDDTRHS